MCGGIPLFQPGNSKRLAHAMHTCPFESPLAAARRRHASALRLWRSVLPARHWLYCGLATTCLHAVPPLLCPVLASRSKRAHRFCSDLSHTCSPKVAVGELFVPHSLSSCYRTDSRTLCAGKAQLDRLKALHVAKLCIQLSNNTQIPLMSLASTCATALAHVPSPPLPSHRRHCAHMLRGSREAAAANIQACKNHSAGARKSFARLEQYREGSHHHQPAGVQLELW